MITLRTCISDVCDKGENVWDLGQRALDAQKESKSCKSGGVS